MHTTKISPLKAFSASEKGKNLSAAYEGNMNHNGKKAPFYWEEGDGGLLL